MEVLKAIGEVTRFTQGSPKVGVTMGNFDGVHFGHREFLQLVRKNCQEKGLKFVVVTFIPHPQKILFPGSEGFLINSYEERRALLEELGVDFLVELPFTGEFGKLGPKDFLDQYVFNQGVQLSSLYLGHDFTFGANKEGDFHFVREYCRDRQSSVYLQQEFQLEHQKVSSSKIRELIREGDFPPCTSLLGREFFLSGPVVKSAGRGKKIGFPTANIELSPDRIRPKIGVYLTRTVYDKGLYHSVTNVGRNPTFESGPKVHVETNIFDFDRDIYGEIIGVHFIKKIRDELKFSGVDSLVEQIRKDVSLAKDFFQ